MVWYVEQFLTDTGFYRLIHFNRPLDAAPLVQSTFKWREVTKPSFLSRKLTKRKKSGRNKGKHRKYQV